MTENDLQQKFRENLIEFFDEIVDICPKEKEFILMRMVVKQIPQKDLIGKFIKDILPLKEHVDTKNDAFFLENHILYIDGKLDDEKIDHFKRLWQNELLDDEERDTIWQWMSLFCKIAEEYKRRYGSVDGWE